MTAVRIVFVSCDPGDEGTGSPDCWDVTGDGSIQGGTFDTAKDARADAKTDGWHTAPGGRDICEPCWEAGHR